MLSVRTPVRLLEAIVLDLVSFPGKFMTKKGNAKWHLKYICSYCSDYRKSFRDIKRGNNCLWEQAWKKGAYDFSRDFGFVNWIRYYLSIKTDLEKYEKEFKELPFD